jgi:hypothetical protein
MAVPARRIFNARSFLAKMGDGKVMLELAKNKHVLALS